MKLVVPETKQISLDAKDRKILAALDWNARITNSELARMAKLSKNAVAYRIKRMEEAGLILGYYPIINFARLGYFSRRITIELQNADAKIKKEMEDYISDPKSRISWAVWIRGIGDLSFVVWTRSLKAFQEIFSCFNKKFGRYIKKRTFTSSWGFEQYPYSIITGKKDLCCLVIDEGPVAKLDLLDTRILHVLNANARQSSTAIAEQIGTSYKTVQYRMRKLGKNKVLLGTRAFVNHSALGYNYYKLMLYFNQYSGELYRKLKAYVIGLFETVYVVYHVDSDLDVELMFKSDNEFFDFIDSLNEKFPGAIKHHEYFAFSRTIQIGYLPPLEAEK